MCYSHFWGNIDVSDRGVRGSLSEQRLVLVSVELSEVWIKDLITSLNVYSVQQAPKKITERLINVYGVVSYVRVFLGSGRRLKPLWCPSAFPVQFCRHKC